MSRTILWVEIALAIEEVAKFKAFSNALDNSHRDLPLFAAFLIHEPSARFLRSVCIGKYALDLK